jgi:hypothetical protein
MTILIAALASLAMQNAAPVMAWTWTLYEGEGPLVLANEVPDTPELRSTFECEPGSGVARVSLYGPSMGSGVARVSAGEASAATEAEARRDRTTMTLRTDHPVFTQFVASGGLEMVLGAQSRAIAVERPHMARLRRFAELCGG